MEWDQNASYKRIIYMYDVTHFKRLTREVLDNAVLLLEAVGASYGEGSKAPALPVAPHCHPKRQKASHLEDGSDVLSELQNQLI